VAGRGREKERKCVGFENKLEGSKFYRKGKGKEKGKEKEKRGKHQERVELKALEQVEKYRHLTHLQDINISTHHVCVDIGTYRYIYVSNIYYIYVILALTKALTPQPTLTPYSNVS